MTAAGSRVEPEVYCNSAVSHACWTGGRRLQRRIEVKRVHFDHRRRAPGRARTQGTTSLTAADVVSIATGALSRRAPEARSSCAPNCGTGSGTATRPASNAPRNPTMYSRPCGATIATRSPTDPHRESSSATTRARWWSCDHVKAFGKPVGVHLVVDERECGIVWLLLRKARERHQGWTTQSAGSRTTPPFSIVLIKHRGHYRLGAYSTLPKLAFRPPRHTRRFSRTAKSSSRPHGRLSRSVPTVSTFWLIAGRRSAKPHQASHVATAGEILRSTSICRC